MTTPSTQTERNWADVLSAIQRGDLYHDDAFVELVYSQLGVDLEIILDQHARRNELWRAAKYEAVRAQAGTKLTPTQITAITDAVNCCARALSDYICGVNFIKAIAAKLTV